MAKVVLWGTGQIADVVYYYLAKDTDHDICAFCVDRAYLNGQTEFHGRPVVAFEDIERLYPPSEYRMAIPIGYKHINKYREEKYRAAKAKGYSFITYISSTSSVDSSFIGENTFIFEHNAIQPFTKIGNNVIIWAMTGIGHHTEVGDHCFLASPKISGAAKIGNNTFIGTNASIGDTIEIGHHCLIGAGAVVVKNVPDGAVLAAKQTKAMPIKSWDMEGILG